MAALRIVTTGALVPTPVAPEVGDTASITGSIVVVNDHDTGLASGWPALSCAAVEIRAV